MIEQHLKKRTNISAMVNMMVFASSSVAIPICLVQIQEELNFSFTQAGLLGFISNLEQFTVLILGIFLAARFGKIRVLRAAMIILSMGLILFTTSRTYMMAAALILIIGLGHGLLEGLLTPLVEDLNPNDQGKKMNLVHAFWPIGVCTTVLSVGELLSQGVSWRIVFLAQAVIIFIASFLYPRRKRINLPKSRADFSHMGEILAQPRFWILGFCLFLAGGAEGSFTFWTATYIQVNFDALPRAGGIGTAVFALGMVIGRISSSRLSHTWGLKRLLVTAAVFTILFSSTFFFIQSLVSLYGAIFAIGISIACMWPSIQSYAGVKIPADITMIMILLSCFGLIGFSSATLIMGIIGDYAGLRFSFLLAPGYVIFLLLLLLTEGILPVKNPASTKE